MARATTNKNGKKAAKKVTKKASPAKSPAKKTSPARSGSNKERILQAIASRVAFGEEKPSRKMIMGLALIISSKSFANLLPALRKDSLVDYDKDSIWLTEKGKEHIGPEALAVPQNNDAMQEKIRSEMLNSKKAREIFDAMSDGRWYTRQEVADKMNETYNKGFQNAIGSLSKITEKQGKKIRLDDICFPAGRPDEDA